MRNTTLSRIFMILVIALIAIAIPCMAFARYSTSGKSTGSSYKRTSSGKTMTITGTILNVNAAKHQVQVRATNGKNYVVRVPSSMKIMTNGKQQSISALKPGMYVKVSGNLIRTNTLTAKSFSETGQVSRPSSTGSANENPRNTQPGARMSTITGTITNVMSSRNEIEVRAANGKTYTVKIPSSVQMMSRGNRIQFSDLKEGTEVRITGQLTGTNRITAKNLNEIPGRSNTSESNTKSGNNKNKKTPSGNY